VLKRLKQLLLQKVALGNFQENATEFFSSHACIAILFLMFFVTLRLITLYLDVFSCDWCVATSFLFIELQPYISQGRLHILLCENVIPDAI
jgi:hypothetical protein